MLHVAAFFFSALDCINDNHLFTDAIIFSVLCGIREVRCLVDFSRVALLKVFPDFVVQLKRYKKSFCHFKSLWGKV